MPTPCSVFSATPLGHASRPRLSATPLKLIAIFFLLNCSLLPLYALPIHPDPGGGSGGDTYTQPSATPGPAYSWEGTVGTSKTGDGNHLTTIPIVSWLQRGGLPVELTLNHNSQSTRNGELGPKWAMNFDTSLLIDSTTGNITVFWGDGRIYTFVKSGANYTPPAGIYDKLLPYGSSSYQLYTKQQIRYTFGQITTDTTKRFLTDVADENGNDFSVAYNTTTGEITTVTASTATTTRTLTFGYNSSNQIISITDPLSRQWTLSYDANGNLAHIYWPVIAGATYSINLGYDANHNITSYQDLRGNTFTFSYNAADNSIAWEKDALGNQTTFQYGVDASGNANALDTTIVDPNGHKTVHTYNTSGQLASVTDALGYTESYTYDTSNNVTQIQDRRGYYWNATFDSSGNTLTAKDPYSNTTTFTYNAHNKLLTIKAPSGRNAVGTYDANDNLTQVQEKDASGNIKSTTTYTIGSYGLVSAKTDSNSHETLYTYDANGYLHTVTTPKSNETQWTYDALGFQTSRTDALNRTTTYTPDAWERLVTTTYPDSSTKTFGYDPNGNLTAFANYTGNWARTYDADNRMLTESLGGTRTVSHSYDAAGQKGLLSTTTDYDGRVISYAYSARNQLTGVGDSVGTATYQYDADGNKTQVNDPNGMIAQWGYDNASRLSAALDATSSGSVIAAYNYAFNTDSQISTLTEGYGPYYSFTQTSQTTYSYDPQGHLTSEVRTGQNAISQTFGYDAVGNRTSFNNGGNNVFSLDADDEPTGQTGANTFVLGYNANGDRTSESVNGNMTTFGYDFDDQLTSLTKSGTTVTYRYDPLGRQVSKSVNGTLTGYYLDGDTVLEEKQGTITTAQYLWGNGLVRCNSEYPLTDGRVNVRLTTNASQSVTSSNQPDAFGTYSVTSGTASAYAYGGAAGYREEGIAPAGLSTGYALEKVGARYYDQAFGAFLTRDTDLSQKPYAYCDGDPVNFIDPNGHKKKKNPHPTTPTPEAGGGANSGAAGGTEGNKQVGEKVQNVGAGIIDAGGLIAGAGIVANRSGPAGATAGGILVDLGGGIVAIGSGIDAVGKGISAGWFSGAGTTLPDAVPLGYIPTNSLGQPLAN